MQFDGIQHSKRWKQRFDPFLRKLILSGAKIEHQIALCIVEFKNSKNDTGRSLFTKNTEKVATEQLKKVQYASDPVGVEMYHKIPAGKRSTHKLPKWASLRPESRLEKFHELLAHMANSGMNAGLSDALTLGGTAEHNIKCRWKHFVNLERLADKDVKIPLHFIDEPQFWDHSLLGYLNEQAQSLALSVPFENVTPIRANNGEVFLSKYFKEQQERNHNKVGFLDSMCQCDTCISYKSTTTLDPPSAAPDNNTDGRRE